MQDLTITLVQCDLIWEDRDANLEAFNRRLSVLEHHSDLIVLPEMFNTGFTMNGEKCADDENGLTVQWLKQKSSALGCVITGSLIIREGAHLYNRLFWMRPDGTYETYNKRHLFRFGNEHEHFEAGDKLLITELNGWKFRPLVCYDLRFPVWSRNRYTDGKFEYDCLLYIANWPERRSHHWTGLLTARAVENLGFAIGLNRVGTDGKGIVYSGDSRVIDPTGSIAGCIEPHTEQMLDVTLSAEALLKWRSNFNAGLDWDGFSLDI
jgi:omega-amidase